MQEFVSMKICTKLSIPGHYISGFRFVGVSLSCRRQNPFPALICKWNPSTSLLCRCCPPSLQFLGRGQQWCGGTELGRGGFTPPVPCAAEMIPEPSWLCARAAVPLPALNYKCQHLHSVFSSHCTGPMKMLPSNSSWGLSSTSTLRYLCSVALRGFLVCFFLQTALQTFFYGPAHPGMRRTLYE